MIDAIKTLLNRTSALEETLESLTKNVSSSESSSNCVSFTKNLLNFSIVEARKILLAQIDVTQNSSLYFQNIIEIILSSDQNVKFSLIVDDISIYKSTKSLSSGFNQITIMKTYTPLSSKQIDIYLEITPLESKQVVLSGESLVVWGISENKKDLQYQALKTKDNFLLAYLDENSLFYILTPQSTSINNAEDFTFYKSAKSFSFVFLEQDEVLLLFRVDANGNLFYSNFNDQNETYVDSGVSYVSASTNGSFILITFIKNNLCYYMTLENEVFSEAKQINCNNSYLEKCYCYYSEKANKFYIVMSDSKNSNFITQSQNEIFDTSDNIKANVMLTISTYGE